MYHIEIKRTKKGFTLIELLAVILILGIVALIAIPTITSVIEDSKKGAIKSTAEFLVDAAEKQCQIERLNGQEITTSYTIINGEISKDLDIKNYPNAGEITVDEDCNAEVAVNDGKYCGFANRGDSSVSSNLTDCGLENMPVPDTEESCFVFDETTRTITGYKYDSPSCSSEVSIPAAINNIPVEHIAEMAFINGEYDFIIAIGFKETENGFEPLSGMVMTLENSLALGQTLFSLYPVDSLTNSINQICYTDMTFTSYDSKPLDYVVNNGDYVACTIDLSNYEQGIDYKLVASSGLERIDLAKATNLVSIGEGSFSLNEIEKVNFGSLPNLTTIGAGAFSGNYIQGTIDLSGLTGLTNIESFLFASNQISELILPSNIKEIRYLAFAENGLKTLDLPNGLERIYLYAFEYNILENITIPNTIKNLTGFDDNLLSSVNIPNGVEIISDYAFARNNIETLTIPTSVTYIGSRAFNVNSLTKLDIPNNVKDFGIFVFSENQLESVNIANGLTEISEGMFHTNNLTSITLPESVTSIGDCAFEKNSLTTVNMLGTVKSIGKHAFINNQLTSVTIPNSMTNVGEEAYALNNLSSVTLGSSSTTYGKNVFGLSSSAIDAIVIPDDWTTVPEYMFYRTKINNLVVGKKVRTVQAFAFGYSAISNITWGESLTTIEGAAFRGISVENLKIPNTVTYIGNSAFQNISSKTVEIPDSVTKIEFSAFLGQSLDSITIGSGINFVGENLFLCQINCHVAITINRTKDFLSGACWGAGGTSTITWNDGITYSCNNYGS